MIIMTEFICLYFITGTEKFIDNLLNLMDHEPSFLLGSVSIGLPMIIIIFAIYTCH